MRPGKPLICCEVCSSIMPAMASDPPEGISTVVSARRTRIDGIVMVADDDGCASVIELSLERSDTSVSTLRLIRPSPRTTGVKLRLTPNFLKSTAVWQVGGTVVVLHDTPDGIGNSPPTR